MKLSKDPVKRALRDNWYWPLMAKYWNENGAECGIMLPGSLPYDALSMKKYCLDGYDRAMIYIDNSFGKVASFNRRFKDKSGKAVTGDIFQELREFDGCNLPGFFGMVDLDLCSCANPTVIENLRELRENPVLIDECVLGLTICRRWKTDAEQEKRIINALAPCVKIDQKNYTNSMGGAHMTTSIYVLKGRVL